MFIEIKGASENNLKNIDLILPKNKLIAFTGLSGSGKSTLAMETLQRECQRQYMESLGMTMNIGTKPKVKSIVGLSPAISIHQHQTSNNPRSTVGTVTEIAPYIRVLFSKVGQRQCPQCDQAIAATEEYQVIECELDTDEVIEEESLEEMRNCPHCGTKIVELTANHFSYNKPQGACYTCHGLGVINSLDPKLLIDYSKSVKEFAIYGWDQAYIDRYGTSLVEAGKHYGFEMPIDIPIGAYDNIQATLLLYGVISLEFQKYFPSIKPPKTVPNGRFEGVITNFMRRYSESRSESASQKFDKFFKKQLCYHCNGSRYNSDTLSVKVLDMSILNVQNLSLKELYKWLSRLEDNLNEGSKITVRELLIDVQMRIKRIINTGAEYLTLSQPSSSLSAGEWQRIKLASVLGSSLTGVLYILDEPTSGLHPRDNIKIVNVLKQLRDMGNTVIVIEHNLGMIIEADYIVEFGPGAGKNGGEIVACGDREEVISNNHAIISKLLKDPFLRRERAVLEQSQQFIKIENANCNNLKNLNLNVPIGRLVCISGVSGSGKSTLVFDCMTENAQKCSTVMYQMKSPDVKNNKVPSQIVVIDQQTIGRSSRSNPATYVDLFADIRGLFASMPETKVKAMIAKHFSYNTPGGRCENCQGTGKKVISMFFLPDIETICPVCKGKRYQKDVLGILYKGHSISDVLDLSIEEALLLFGNQTKIVEKLKILQDVGLGYLSLGQSTATLSGGEAQRLKLAKELILTKGTNVLYLLDEPMTGLHSYDIKKMIKILSRLVSQGNSVVVIEHHLEMILESDWVIDLGPEGGKEGGNIVFEGTPFDLMRCENSYTGKWLRQKVKLK